MSAPACGARYDRIGAGYARTRREDPAIAARLDAALGDAHTVLNVGAGAGSYEPRDRHVIAIEPSDVMAAQRSPTLPPAIRSYAHDLPLRDASVDASLAVLTLHHWDGTQAAGLRELRRVTRGPIALLTFDATVSERMWLMADYLPELAELDRRIFPPPERIAGWLDGDTDIETIPIGRDTPDWTLGSFWAHPERVLDPVARRATSGFARLPPNVTARVARAVERDLRSGAWAARHGHLLELEAYDAGMRLIVSRPSA